MENTALRFCMKPESVSLFSPETHEERSLQLVKQGLEKETTLEIMLLGLPKVHKPEPAPLRPILSMVGSAQHELARCEGRNKKCDFLARESVSSSPIVRIFGKGKCKFIANFSATMVTSLPSLSLSLSLCLYLSLSLSHRKYLTHNIGSASALPIIKEKTMERMWMRVLTMNASRPTRTNTTVSKASEARQTWRS